MSQNRVKLSLLNHPEMSFIKVNLKLMLKHIIFKVVGKMKTCHKIE